MSWEPSWWLCLWVQGGDWQDWGIWGGKDGFWLQGPLPELRRAAGGCSPPLAHKVPCALCSPVTHMLGAAPWRPLLGAFSSVILFLSALTPDLPFPPGNLYSVGTV